MLCGTRFRALILVTLADTLLCDGARRWNLAALRGVRHFRHFLPASWVMLLGFGAVPHHDFAPSVTTLTTTVFAGRASATKTCRVVVCAPITAALMNTVAGCRGLRTPPTHS